MEEVKVFILLEDNCVSRVFSSMAAAKEYLQTTYLNYRKYDMVDADVGYLCVIDEFGTEFKIEAHAVLS